MEIFPFVCLHPFLLPSQSTSIYLSKVFKQMPPLPAYLASNGPGPEIGGAPHPDTHNKYRALIDSAINTQNAEFNHCWFEVLEAFGYFRQMPGPELLEFARELANGVDMKLSQSMYKRADLQPWGRRMLHLTEIIEENASTSLLPIQEDVKALAARGHAFLGDMNEPRKYIWQHMESEGSRMVVSQDDFDKSHFHQVVTSFVLSIENLTYYMFPAFSFFRLSYLRWKETQTGVEKFLIDKKLDQVLIRTVNHPDFVERTHSQLLKHLLFSDEQKYMADEMPDFLLAALNGNGNYHTAKDLIIKLHTAETFCSASLVADTIRGLLSESNGMAESDNLMLNQIAEISKRPPNALPTSEKENQSYSSGPTSSKDPESCAPGDKRPKKRTRKDK